MSKNKYFRLAIVVIMEALLVATLAIGLCTYFATKEIEHFGSEEVELDVQELKKFFEEINQGSS